MDAELAVDAGEVGFDRVDADVESGGDLLVGEAFGSEGGEPCFRRREGACGGGAAADAGPVGGGGAGPRGGGGGGGRRGGGWGGWAGGAPLRPPRAARVAGPGAGG